MGPDTALRLRELERTRLRLTEEEARFLLSEDRPYLDLRPVLGEREAWTVRAEATCGVIPLPSGRALYIEPKVGLGSLWHMLVYAYDLVQLGAQPAGHETTGDLIESLVEVFARQAAWLVKRGLLQSYEPRTESLAALRGRLDLAENLRRNLAARHQLACRYDDLTVDILENRILRWTLLRMLPARPWRVRVRRPLDNCERRLGEVTLEHIEDRHFTDLRFTRLNEHYRTPLNLARLLLALLAVTHRVGAQTMLPLLVDLTLLFERFIQRMLAEKLAAASVEVGWEGRGVPLDEAGRIRLTPDIVLRRHGRPVCLVDAKYKTGFAGAEDVYQMLAYCVGYGVSTAALVYPGPLARAPVCIRKGGLHVTIHTLGLDLTGDAAQFEVATDRLAAQVGHLAG